jgi:hypothetical protein
MDQTLFLFLDEEEVNQRHSQLHWTCRGLLLSTKFLVASSKVRAKQEPDMKAPTGLGLPPTTGVGTQEVFSKYLQRTNIKGSYQLQVAFFLPPLQGAWNAK